MKPRRRCAATGLGSGETSSGDGMPTQLPGRDDQFRLGTLEPFGQRSIGFARPRSCCRRSRSWPTRPGSLPRRARAAGARSIPSTPHPLNLFRVHWYNDAARHRRPRPRSHRAAPRADRCRGPIVVALGDRFPMIRAHKVLAAYAVPGAALVTGHFDPTAHRASGRRPATTAAAASPSRRIMGCRGVAVLPEGMSQRALPLARALDAPTRTTSSARRAPRAT